MAIWTKLKLLTVEPILFSYFLIIFLESNAIQNLIYVKSCIRNLNSLNETVQIDYNNCSFHKKKEFNNEIIADATFWIRFNSVFLYFSTFLSCLYVASWTDKFGRKFAMIIPPLGTIVAALINIILSVFIETSVVFLFISSTISGLTFGTVGITSSTFGFISDISDESSRTKRMFILETMIYFGSTIGIYVAGEFLKYPDYNLKVNGFAQLFIFELSLSALIMLYAVFRIPHQREETESPPMTCGNLFTLDHIKDALKAVFRPRENGRRKTVLLLMLALCFISSGIVVQFTLSYLYLAKLDDKYWNFHNYSTFYAAQLAVEGAALLLGMPLFLHVLHMSDYFLASLGIISKMAGFLLFGLSSSSVMVYSCIALFAFSEYPVPTIRSMLSKVVDADETGKIFTFTTLLPNFCFLILSLTLTSIFEATSFFPGLCFECVAGLQFMALCIIIYLYFTREEIFTTYQIMENEDGSVVETCVVGRTTGTINS